MHRVKKWLAVSLILTRADDFKKYCYVGDVNYPKYVLTIFSYLVHNQT